MAIEVHGQAGCKLALRHNNAVAGAVFQQLDRFAIHCVSERCFKAVVANCSNLSYGIPHLISAIDGSYISSFALGNNSRIQFFSKHTAGNEALLSPEGSNPLIKASPGNRNSSRSGRSKAYIPIKISTGNVYGT